MCSMYVSLSLYVIFCFCLSVIGQSLEYVCPKAMVLAFCRICLKRTVDMPSYSLRTRNGIASYAAKGWYFSIVLDGQL